MLSQLVASAPAWTIPGYLETRDNHLHIDGVDAVRLADEYDTPLYVFSEPRIRHNIERLKRAAKRPPLVLSSASGQGVQEALRALLSVVDAERTAASAPATGEAAEWRP